jgi:hypothetical protein
MGSKKRSSHDAVITLTSPFPFAVAVMMVACNSGMSGHLLTMVSHGPKSVRWLSGKVDKAIRPSFSMATCISWGVSGAPPASTTCGRAVIVVRY